MRSFAGIISVCAALWSGFNLCYDLTGKAHYTIIIEANIPFAIGYDSKRTSASKTGWVAVK